MTTRDTPSSSSVPSARTVTRYTPFVDADGDVGFHGDTDGLFCFWGEVSSLLTALADSSEQRISELCELHETQFLRADKAEAALADKETEIATLKQEIDAWVCIRCTHEDGTDLRPKIVALTARAEAAEAKAINTEVKCGQEIINLRTQLVAAEATLATLREEFQRHKDLSFKLFTDAVDRADKSEATVAHLRELMTDLIVEVASARMSAEDRHRVGGVLNQFQEALRAVPVPPTTGTP